MVCLSCGKEYDGESCLQCLDFLAWNETEYVELFNEIKQIIPKKYLHCANISMEHLKGKFNDKNFKNKKCSKIVLTVKQSMYFPKSVSVTLCYIIDNCLYFSMLDKKGIININVNSSVFIQECEKMIAETIDKLIPVNSFGCCNDYVTCSDNLECIHANAFYAVGCMYKKNLEAGRVFYGKNQTLKKVSYSVSDFIAIDFETAETGSEPAPCALGITVVIGGKIVQTFEYLINPEIPIEQHLQRIHGITDAMVSNSPTFISVWNDIRDLFNKYPLVAHNMEFDYRVLCGALKKYGFEIPTFILYDTHTLCKRYTGENKTNLPCMCQFFNLSVRDHHSSSDDSLMCAEIFLALQSKYCCEPEIYKSKTKVNPRLNFSNRAAEYVEAIVTYDEVDNFTLRDNSFVITGKVGEFGRNELHDFIIQNGGIIQQSPTKQTSFLIVGFEDITLVKDKQNAKSNKIIKAEQLRSQGYGIKIISDEFFLKHIDENILICSVQ